MEELEERLCSELRFQLVVHTNMASWEVFDQLDSSDWENINATIRDVFASWIYRYGYTKAVPILQQTRNTLIRIVWAAMNVPFPRDPIEHIERVIENTLDAFRQTVRESLRHEMLMANHHAHVVQRNWRRAVADPSYVVCRKRLLFEFKKISSESDMYGDIFSVPSGLQTHVQS
jgi:hypothetical protein